MADEVLLNKAAALERAVDRVREEHADIVRRIVAEHLDDFLKSARVLVRLGTS